MSIQADSRYANGTFVPVMVNGETSQMLWQSPLILDDIQFQYYTVIDGDRLDILASRFFNDSTKWWLISDMNPEVHWPTDLTAGHLIRVPLALLDDATGAQTVNFVSDV